MDDYLSTTVVTNSLQRICRDTEQVFDLISCTEWGLHERKVAIAFVVSYTTFPPLLFSKRFISVALSLKSPSQGVTLHSCSVVLGLSSLAIKLLPQSSGCLLSGIVVQLHKFVNQLVAKTDQPLLILAIFFAYCSVKGVFCVV